MRMRLAVTIEQVKLFPKRRYLRNIQRLFRKARITAMRQSLAKGVCAVLLVSTLIGEQQSSATDCGCEYQVGVPAVQAIQRYSGDLPRDRDEDVAVVLYVPSNKYGCCPTNNPSQPGIFPTKFELQTPSGFRVRFRSGIRYRSYKPGTTIKLPAGEKIVLLKIRADREMPLGEYALHGKLTYQAMPDQKLQPPQTLEVVISVNLKDRKSKPQEIDWEFGTHVKHDLLVLVALPVEIPAAILLAIACNTGKGCDL